MAATELLLAAHRVLYRQEKVDRAVAELTELGYADRFTSLTMHIGEDEGRAALVGPSAAMHTFVTCHASPSYRHHRE